jgi:hypothetical protein
MPSTNSSKIDKRLKWFGHDVCYMSGLLLEREMSLHELSEELGSQYIMGSSEIENRDFAYLGAIALETAHSDDYELSDTLLEFINNASSFEHLDDDDIEEIEEKLR